MSEWKPGDLIADADGNVFWVIEVTENTRAAAQSGRAWTEGSSVVDADGNGWRPGSLDRPHRLAVIDPEDDEQVKRFAGIYAHLQGLDEAGRATITAIHAALREFVRPAPPKPDEPTGLGAVVEDAEGNRWTRIDRDHTAWCRGSQFPQRWRDLDVVRVLSPGVEATP